MRKYEPPREGWTITYITTDIKYIMWYCWKWCSQSVTMHQNENAQPSTLNFENFSRRCLEPPHCGKATLAATQIITPNPLVSSVIRDQVYYLVVFLESSLDSVYLEPRERVRWLQMLFYFCWTKPENWNLLEIFKIFFRWCINTQNTPSYGCSYLRVFNENRVSAVLIWRLIVGFWNLTIVWGRTSQAESGWARCTDRELRFSKSTSSWPNRTLWRWRRCPTRGRRCCVGTPRWGTLPRSSGITRPAICSRCAC